MSNVINMFDRKPTTSRPSSAKEESFADIVKRNAENKKRVNAERIQANKDLVESLKD